VLRARLQAEAGRDRHALAFNSRVASIHRKTIPNNTIISTGDVLDVIRSEPWHSPSLEDACVTRCRS
jgi:hypothetical protein